LRVTSSHDNPVPAYDEHSGATAATAANSTMVMVMVIIMIMVMIIMIIIIIIVIVVIIIIIVVITIVTVIVTSIINSHVRWKKGLHFSASFARILAFQLLLALPWAFSG
jgi:uncharacterized membrane protein